MSTKSRGSHGYPWVISVGIGGSFPWVSVGIRAYPTYQLLCFYGIETDFIDELKRFEEEAHYDSNTIDITIILLEERDGQYIMNNSLRDFVYPGRSRVSNGDILFNRAGEHYSQVKSDVYVKVANS